MCMMYEWMFVDFVLFYVGVVMVLIYEMSFLF